MSYKTIITKSIRKSITLKLDKTGNILIKAPILMTKKSIKIFIEKNKAWIEKKRSELKDKVPLNFECGDKILFLGKCCKIKKVSKKDIYKHRSQYTEKDINKGLKTLVMVGLCDTLENNIHFEDNIFYINEDLDKKDTKEIIRYFYKKEAKHYIVKRTEYFIKKYDLKVNSIKIGSAKTRWGTCNSKKDIRFTYLLMSAPLLSIDYVIIHELAHLKEMNHSKAFWSEVERMMSDYKVHKEWFKQNRGISLF